MSLLNRCLHSCDFYAKYEYKTTTENEAQYSKRELKKLKGVVELIENSII